MCIGCWITKATDKHSEYIILIVLPGQQLLRKCTSILCYTTYMAYLIDDKFHILKILHSDDLLWNNIHLSNVLFIRAVRNYYLSKTYRIKNIGNSGYRKIQ